MCDVDSNHTSLNVKEEVCVKLIVRFLEAEL
jgi:hypothetical protein